MARHRHHRRHRVHRGSRSLVPGVSNTTLAVGAAAAYFLFLRPAPAAGTAGLEGTRAIGPGLGRAAVHPANWGRPVLPVAGAAPARSLYLPGYTQSRGGYLPGYDHMGLHGLGHFFTGFRGGLGAFEADRGFWPAHLHGGLGALVRTIHGHLAGAGLGTLHVMDYAGSFAGGHGTRGLGNFNNVSLNRRWWT